MQMATYILICTRLYLLQNATINIGVQTVRPCVCVTRFCHCRVTTWTGRARARTGGMAARAQMTMMTAAPVTALPPRVGRTRSAATRPDPTRVSVPLDTTKTSLAMPVWVGIVYL
jgi:hypothetical protein